jgi:hypothetical protein
MADTRKSARTHEDQLGEERDAHAIDDVGAGELGEGELGEGGEREGWVELTQGGLLTGEVFAGVGLRAADVDGLSDPYLIYRLTSARPFSLSSLKVSASMLLWCPRW